jgi:hypothetical protein
MWKYRYTCRKFDTWNTNNRELTSKLRATVSQPKPKKTTTNIGESR